MAKKIQKQPTKLETKVLAKLIKKLDKQVAAKVDSVKIKRYEYEILKEFQDLYKDAIFPMGGYYKERSISFE